MPVETQVVRKSCEAEIAVNDFMLVASMAGADDKSFH